MTPWLQVSVSQNSYGCSIHFLLFRLLLGRDFSLLIHLFTHPTHLITECHPKAEWWFWTRMVICAAKGKTDKDKIIASYVSPLVIVTLPSQLHSYCILKPLLAFKALCDKMQMNLIPTFWVAKIPLLGGTNISFHLELSQFTSAVPAQLFCTHFTLKSILFWKKKVYGCLLVKKKMMKGVSVWKNSFYLWCLSHC